MDRNGAIYEATLNIADGRNGKILYDINKIRRIDAGVVPSTNDGRGSLRTINSSRANIPNLAPKVKSNNMDEEQSFLLDPEDLKDVPKNDGQFLIDGEEDSFQKTDFDQEFDYSQLNWAEELGIITEKDRAIFERTINNEILRGAKPQSANGEYIIDTGKCLMFTDGDFHSPTLSRVVEFATEYESLTADAKEWIINEAKATGDLQESRSAIERMFGQGFVSIHIQPNGRTYGGQNRGRKGNNRIGTAQKAKSLKERLAEEGLSHLVEDEEQSFLLDPEDLKDVPKNDGQFSIDGEEDSFQKTDFDQEFDYSQLNWAEELGIITEKDRAIFERTINNEILRGAKPQSANGEYIIDTGKCLMFTDGDFHNPTLSRVIVFSTDYESLLYEAKRRIYDEARSTGDVQESQQVIEDLYGPGFAVEYTQTVYSPDAWQDRGRKGENGKGSNRGYRTKSLKERPAEEGLSHLVEDEEQSFLLDPEDLKDVPWYEPGMTGKSIGPEQIPRKIDSAKDAMQAADALRDARQDRERPFNVPKEEFVGTDHLQALGVKVANSVGDYWGIAQNNQYKIHRVILPGGLTFYISKTKMKQILPRLGE